MILELVVALTISTTGCYPDDAIIVAFVPRCVTRRGGPDAVAKYWPGTLDG
jgi:hypothetical protein